MPFAPMVVAVKGQQWADRDPCWGCNRRHRWRVKGVNERRDCAELEPFPLRPGEQLTRYHRERLRHNRGVRVVRLEAFGAELVPADEA